MDDNRDDTMMSINGHSKVSVGPSGSGAQSPRIREKGVWLRQNLIFVGALAFVIALAAVAG